MTLQVTLKVLRASKDISQAKLAKAIGTSQQTIAAWEKGQVPSAENISKLADYFNISFQEMANIFLKKNTNIFDNGEVDYKKYR